MEMPHYPDLETISESFLSDRFEGLKTLVEASPDAMMLIDHGGKIVIANKQTGHLFGYPSDRLIGMSIEQMIPERFREKHAHERESFVLGQDARPMGKSDLYALRSNGTEFEADISLNPFPTPEGLYVVCVVRDVTEARRAERAIQAGQERFFRVFQHAPVPIKITRSHDDTILFVNQSYVDVSGFTPEELVGKRTLDLGFYVRPQPYRRLLRLVQQNGYFNNEEVQIRDHQGSFHEMLASAQIIDLDGESCVLTIYNDVTDRRRLERELAMQDIGEQRQIGFWLHEDLAQQLSAVSLMCGILLQRLDSESSEHAAYMRRISDRLATAITSSRAISRRLNPVDVHADGLAFALRALAYQTENIYGVSCSFSTNGPSVAVDNDVATYLYRVAQETIAALMRVARSSAIHLELAIQARRGVMRIKNTPAQGEQSAAPHDLEIESMRYRAGMVGASVDIRKGTRGSTVIECFFDL